MNGLVFSPLDGNNTNADPTLLWQVRGKSLLARHQDAFYWQRIACTFLIGAGFENVKQSVSERSLERYDMVEIPAEAEGTVAALYAARDRLVADRDGPLLVEANLIYSLKFLRRVYATGPTTVAVEMLDADEDGPFEGVLTAFGDERVRALTMEGRSDWDLLGQPIGMYRINPRDAPRLVEILEEMVAQQEAKEPYTEALARLIAERGSELMPMELRWAWIGSQAEGANAELIEAVDATDSSWDVLRDGRF